MTREEFTGPYLGYQVKKIPEWTADEDTPLGHLKNMHHNMGRHIQELEKVLNKYEEPK